MSTDTPAQQPSIDEQINTLTDSMAKNPEGKWALPEGHEAPELMQHAAMAERRRRDTQGEFSRSQQALKVLQAENTQLTDGWSKDVASALTAEQRTELDTLKHEDPDAWRQKLNQYESENHTTFTEKTSGIKAKAQQETELESRTRLLDEHNTANPDFALTDDVIANDLPPRFTKQLESGEISFADFVAKSMEFMGKPKVVAGTEAPGDPSLSKAPGGSLPSDIAVASHANATYKDETY
jgi:Skp family chaperone for outer membrane proteins